MKLDPYKAKASRAWKRKHKIPKEETVQVEQSDDSSGTDDPVDAPVETDLERDTNILLDLKNKVILSDQKSDIDLLNLQFKFTLQLDTQERTKGKSFKGFHDQILSNTDKTIEPHSDIVKGDKPHDLEEWLDDILG